MHEVFSLRHRSWAVRKGLGQAGLFVIAAAIAAVMILPLLWMFTGALKTKSLLLAETVINLIPPRPLQWRNFHEAWTAMDFTRFLMNTLIITATSMVGGLLTASMVAYLSAQLIDVQLFHVYKRLTRGRHLWLRNNGSTLISQLVDTVTVILITHFYAGALPIEPGRSLWPQLFAFIGAGYAYKVLTALLDTLPFYLGSHWLRRALRLPPPTAA